MKKFFICLFFIPFLLDAQTHLGAVKLGFFTPSATETGFIIGYQWGRRIDNNVSVGWSVDWFNKNYVDKNLVSQLNEFYGPISGSLNEVRAKTNLHSVPIMGNLEGHFPLGHRLNLYFSGSAGLEILLIFYRNYDSPDNSTLKGAYDFCWRFGGGILYELGARSDILLELAYHSSKPSWQYTVTDNGRTRVFERLYDMSGLMARLGVRFYY